MIGIIRIINGLVNETAGLATHQEEIPTLETDLFLEIDRIDHVIILDHHHGIGTLLDEITVRINDQLDMTRIEPGTDLLNATVTVTGIHRTLAGITLHNENVVEKTLETVTKIDSEIPVEPRQIPEAEADTIHGNADMPRTDNLDMTDLILTVIIEPTIIPRIDNSGIIDTHQTKIVQGTGVVLLTH
jgi:hypothetical protein